MKPKHFLKRVQKSLHNQILTAYLLRYLFYTTSFLAVCFSIDLALYHFNVQSSTLSTPYLLFLVLLMVIPISALCALAHLRTKALSLRETAFIVDKLLDCRSAFLCTFDLETDEYSPVISAQKKRSPEYVVSYSIDYLHLLFIVPLLLLIAATFLLQGNPFTNPETPVLSRSSGRKARGTFNKSGASVQDSTSSSQSRTKNTSNKKNTSDARNQPSNSPSSANNKSASRNTPSELYGDEQKTPHKRVEKQVGKQGNNGPKKQGEYLEKQTNPEQQSRTKKTNPAPEIEDRKTTNNQSRKKSPETQQFQFQFQREQFAPPLPYDRETNEGLKNYFRMKDPK